MAVPALFTSTSSPPNVLTVFSTALLTASASPARARSLYELLGTTLASLGVQVAYGEFGAHMAVELVNDGPVTILVDTKRLF